MLSKPWPQGEVASCPLSRLTSLLVIRCFPHCCPHTDYRGCGASLSLRVDLASSVVVDRLHAFGRFEVAAETAFADRERVEWTTFSSDMRSKDNVFGMWLEGLCQVCENRTAAFHFNKSRTDGWHYNWRGGSSKQKRNELHRFHVYVVRRVSDTQCTILLSAYTPGFTLVSYRRAVGSKSLEKPQAKAKKSVAKFKLQQISSDHVLDDAEKLIRLFHICSGISLDDIPPLYWLAIEEKLLNRCVEWSGLRHPSMVLLPEELRFYSEKPWTAANEIAMQVLWTWFDKSTFEFCSQVFQTHKANKNMRAAYNAVVHVFYAFVTKKLQKDVEPLEDVLKAFRINKTNTSSDSMGYDAFVSASRESSMEEISIKPQDALLGINGLWQLQSATTRRLDVRPSIYNFFRLFTMVFAFDLRTHGNVVFMQSKLLMFPAPWTCFHLDGKANTFHTLPNGEACGLDQTALVGGYKAWMDFNTIQLWIYRWPRPGHRSGYLLRVSINPSVLDYCAMSLSWTLEEADAGDLALSSLQVNDRMNAWEEMEHTVVFQADTTYTRVDSLESVSL
ncbi:hypothetical protein AeRB84_012870 [Aphanomyces euteiches]|nr:hypothetical protein AeRB84_012870 [Aphanomyces euteiches]